MAPTRTQPSAAFSSRELNGEVLLDSLNELRNAQVHQKYLAECAVSLREFGELRVADAATRLRQLASSRFASQPALAGLLVRWAQKLKTDGDVRQLISHFERLALTAAIVSALRRANDRLPRSRP